MTKFAEDHDDYEPKHRREMTTIPGYGDIEVIRHKSVPDDTMYLAPRGMFDRFLTEDPYPPGSIFFSDPWAVANPAIKPEFESERRKALDHLSGLLDDLCRHFGMDPQKAWRDPRLREQERIWRDWRFNERISMEVINPKSIVAKITGF